MVAGPVDRLQGSGLLPGMGLGGMPPAAGAPAGPAGAPAFDMGGCARAARLFAKPQARTGAAAARRLMSALTEANGAAAAPGAPGTPAPPRERFATQLQKLSDMGFTDEAANLTALEATGGSVNAAVERLLQ